MKILITTAFIFANLVLLSQDLQQQLNEIKTIKHAKKFIQANPSLGAELVTFTSADTASVAKQLLGESAGYTFSDEHYSYKNITAETIPVFRASYIYFDGLKLSRYKIDQQRKEILEKYKAGTPFSELANQFSMDGNAKRGGDLGWFKENMMAKDFETAVRAHKAGEIFVLDIPENNWYYIVLKTHNDREIKTISVLKIKNGQ